MAGKPKKSDDDFHAARPPATSREARQAQMENLALDLIEQRLRDGTASSQETTLFAKSASTRGKKEEIFLDAQIDLAYAKKSNLESQEELQKMFTEAIAAINSYKVEGTEGGENIL